VAQFVALRPEGGSPQQTYCRIAGHEPNELFLDPRAAVDALLACSSKGKVNVRSFMPDDPRSREFVYGLPTTDEAVATLRRLTAEGLHTIVNETIDISDGGVSGVVQGDTIEFAPDDTPRYVDVAVQRWQHLTGEKAILDGERADFDTIAAGRAT
jgi:hypothetical protein